MLTRRALPEGPTGRGQARCRGSEQPRRLRLSAAAKSHAAAPTSNDAACASDAPRACVSRRQAGLAAVAAAWGSLAGGHNQAAVAAAPPAPPAPFCGVAERVPAWAYSTPWQEDLIASPSGNYKIWYRDVNNLSLNGVLSGLQRRYAPVGKRPVLVVAGGPGLPHNYLESLELLAAFRRVVFYDPVGTGISYLASGRTGPPASAISLQSQLDELHAVATALKLADGGGGSDGSGFHIYGHGVGGMLALQYAASRGGAAAAGVTSLMLASTPDSYASLIEDRRAAARALGGRTAELLLGEQGQGAAGESAQYAAALAEYDQRYVCHALQRAGNGAPGCVAASGRSAPAFEALMGGRVFSTAGQLAGWDGAALAPTVGAVPALVCRGEDDEVSAASASRLAGALAGGRLVSLSGSGSYMHIDAWERHLEALEEHMSAAEGSVSATQQQ